MELPPDFSRGAFAESGVIREAVQTGIDHWRSRGFAKTELAEQTIIADHAANTLSADLQVEGALGPDSTPSVTGTVSVSDGSIRVAGTPLLEAVRASVDLAEDGALRPQVDGRLLDGS